MIDYDNLYSNESIQGYDVSEYRKHMRYYKVNEAFEEEYWGPEYLEPWVSLTTGDSLVHYNKKPIGQYLTIEALTNGSIVWKSSDNNITRTIEYSKNGGPWTAIESSVNGNNSYITVAKGDKVMFRGDNQQYAEVIDPDYKENDHLDPCNNSNVRTVSFNNTTCDFNVYGNIMSLIKKDPAEFSVLKDLSGECNFYGMFRVANRRVKSIDGLMLPATGITDGCYAYMFDSQSISNPMDELPALEIKNSCYRAMFNGCWSLLSVPTIRGLNEADSCFRRMFYGCTSLTSIPENYFNETDLSNTYACHSSMFYGCSLLRNAPKLPAIKMGYSSYYGMFYNCSNLVEAPELPAMELGERCYQNMFTNCTSLISAPVLSAMDLKDLCYERMFVGCTSLINTQEKLPATTLKQYCYHDMFSGCTSLTTAPELTAQTLEEGCYLNMFYNCTNLNYIKCLALFKDVLYCTGDWTTGVSESGTFVKDAEATWPTGNSGIPSGWTIVDYVPGN